MRLAFVVQRYGTDVHGGSEAHCREWAERLAKRHEVHVFTTCARDYLTWADFYAPGTETINGVQVHRFAVDAPRDLASFNEFSHRVLATPHSDEQEQEWMHQQGPYSSALFEAIQSHHAQFDLFIFMTYLYATTAFGLPLVADRAVLTPTAHDELPIYLRIFQQVFKQARYLLFNTATEERFLRRLYPQLPLPGSEVAVGVDLPQLVPDEQRSEPPTLLYIGRVHTSKNCEQLYEYVVRYKQERASPLRLVFAGRADIDLPPHPDVLHLGFVSDEEKQRWLQQSTLLVQPSAVESLSMVCLEAWAACTPTLVNSQAEVLREQSVRSGGGLFYRDYDEFAVCLDVLLADHALCRRLGQQGRHFVERYYSWPTVEARLEQALAEAYQEVCGSPPPIPLADVSAPGVDSMFASTTNTSLLEQRHPDVPIDREAVVWAYHLLLDRELESEDIIHDKLRAYRTVQALRADLMTSTEFRLKNPGLAYSSTRNVVIKELDDQLRLFVDLSDQAIGLNIVHNRYERSELSFVRSVVRPGQRVLDIGANIGLFTITIAALVGKTGHVYAFEPVPSNADLLRRSIAENRFEQWVTFQQAAVGAASGTAQIVFAKETTNSGGAALWGARDHLDPGHETCTVDVVALDQYDLRHPVSLIKIDVEGAEPWVFEGAEQLLRTDRPTILSELHADQLRKVAGYTPARYLADMRKRGYQCHLLQDGQPAQRIDDMPGDDVWSVVFLPT